MPPSGCLPNLVGTLVHLFRREEHHAADSHRAHGIQGRGNLPVRRGLDPYIQGECGGRLRIRRNVRGHRSIRVPRLIGLAGGAGIGIIGDNNGAVAAPVPAAIGALALVIAVDPASHNRGRGTEEQGIAEHGVSVLQPQQRTVVGAVKGITQAKIPADRIGGDVVHPVLPQNLPWDRGLSPHRRGGPILKIKGHGLPGEVIENELGVVLRQPIV